MILFLKQLLSRCYINILECKVMAGFMLVAIARCYINILELSILYYLGTLLLVTYNTYIDNVISNLKHKNFK